jgi:multicomponent Na+:H+ antiporter subunit F
MSAAYETLFTVTLSVLGVLLFPCLLRAIRGPRIADRVVGINMIGTIIIMVIAVLALMLEEGYLVDIAIIYAILSFLAVVVLVKIYIGVYRAQKIEEEKRHD